MSIQRKSLAQREFSNILMRSAPRRLQLIRALPLNCTGGNCFANGRGSVSALCAVCDGTGYLTGTQAGGAAQNPPFSQAPYAKTFFIYADLQLGHGLYGSGGDYLRLIADLGKQDIGDSTIFCKMWDYDHTSGNIIYPVIDPTLPRPDMIVSQYGKPYNIVREIIAEIGNEQICRIFSANVGSFGVMGTR
jgi:hypothetical protein